MSKTERVMHLIKNSCADECDVWCDAYLTTADQTTDPREVTCSACLFAAEPHARAVIRRCADARYAGSYGYTLLEVTK